MLKAEAVAPVEALPPLGWALYRSWWGPASATLLLTSPGGFGGFSFATASTKELDLKCCSSESASS